jgi:hypothetical protein
VRGGEDMDVESEVERHKKEIEARGKKCKEERMF